MNLRILFCFISCFIISSLCAQNLIPNGDFEQGNGIGFQSDYNFINPGAGQANSIPRQYAIIDNPFLLNTNNFINSGDYTTGTGLMMVCDGASGQSEIFWKTNGDILLEAGQTYRFRFFIRSVNATNPQPEIGFRIMAAAATYFNATYTVTDPSTGWQEVSYEYTVSEPGAPNRRFELYNVNQSAVGNDFAIDEIILERLDALEVNFSALNVSCFGANDGSIVVYGLGGTQPYTSYSISGPVNVTNTTGVFIGLPAGSYTASVTDSDTNTATVGGIIITEPNDITISPDRTICLGESATLTASGADDYLWSAVPADPSISDPTSASIVVTPDVTTTYTVNTTTVTPRNLIFNGDFNLGNTGFTTDYQYLDPVNPVGVQGAYAVVTNSQTWFAGFSNCTDNTTGTGNMMVLDGSIANAGNDKVWCQTVPVTPGLNYTFSYWVQTVATPNPANLEVLINGVSIGSNLAPSTTCGWVQRSYTWNSGADTVAEICIYDRVVTAPGNDFAIDDIEFVTDATCNLSASVTVTVQSISATAAFTIGDSTECPGPRVLTFSGTPNTNITVQSSSGAFYNIPINSAGTASFTTPFLADTTTFTLISIFQNPPGCTAPLTGSVTITISLNGCATVEAGGVDLGDSASAQICEVGDCVDLEASYVDLGSTTAYTVSSIDYCPQAAYNDPTYNPINLATDDVWSSTINLPFNFCFFGNIYSTCHVGSNGTISFDPSIVPNSGSPWNLLGQSVPSPGFPIRNAIYGVYQDTNPALGPSPNERFAGWKLVGTYPCRKLIVNFYHFGQFQCGQGVGLQTYQMVLYEVSNIIEVYIESRTPCNTWNTPAGGGVVGIMNQAGTLGYVPPGRNTTTQWSAFNEAWRFTPAGPSATTFEWLENGLPYSTDLSITVCPTVTTTYTAVATYNQCGQITEVESDFLVEVFPDTGNDPDDLNECENLFDLTENDAVMIGTGDPFAFSIGYFTSESDAELLLNQIPNPTNYVAISNPQTIYASVLDFNTGCNRIKEFEIQWNSCDLDPDATDLVLCDEVTLNDNFEIFDLTENDDDALNGLDPTLYTVTYHTNQADANVGAAPIVPANAYNGTTETIYVRVEENANPSAFGTTSFSLTVNPSPSIADISIDVCSNDSFNETPVTAGTDVVPAGTTYTWTVAAPVGITGASDEATPQSSIGQTLTNTTDAPLLVTYTVLASVGTAPNICTYTFEINVVVNPKPSISDFTPSICSAQTFTVSPTTAGTDLVPMGTTYTWTVVAPAGITGASDQASAQANISQTLTNTTDSSLDVVYTVTASAGVAPDVCTDTFTVTVTVNPLPNITDKAVVICSEDTFSVTPVTASPEIVPTGTTYTWTVVAPVGIIGASDQATAQANISQALTNTTDAPLDAVYSVTASVGTAPNICTDTFTITVTVNPKPNITDKAVIICSEDTFTVMPVTASPEIVPTGTTYTWTVVAPAGITGASDQVTAQANISQTLTNTTDSPIDVVYTVTASAGVSPDVCTDTFMVTVTVNPKPSISASMPSICSGQSFSVTPTTGGSDLVPVGTTYTWNVAAPAGITGASNQGTPQTTISQTLTNSTTASLDVVYTVTASAGVVPNVCTDTFVIIVTVNPLPIIDNKVAVICSEDTFTITPSNTLPDVVPTGTTYTWSVSSPAGISGASNQATPQPSISQTLTNSTDAAIDVVYTVEASVGTAPNVCADTFTITVTVNPKPFIEDKTATICSEDTFTLSPTTTGSDLVPVGTAYTWTVAAPAGITGSSNQGAPQTQISQTLTNSTDAAIAVVYTITATSGIAPDSCSSTFDLTVTVNPRPFIADVVQVICTTETFTVTPVSAGTDLVPVGTTYTWTVVSPAGITGASNQGTPQTNISQTLTNATELPIDVVYTVTAASTGCTDTFEITVTVNPTPLVAVNSPTVCSGDLATLTASSTTPGTYAYAWTVPATVSNPGNVASFTTTEAGNYSVIITDTVTGCVSASASGTVSLLPLPTASVSGDVTICPTGEATITFSATPGTTIEYTIGAGGIQTQGIDASGLFTITDTYTTTTVFTLVGVFTSTSPVCSVPYNQTATVTVAPAPAINSHPDLVLCDDNNDGIGQFDLAQTESVITGGATGLTVSYHETLVDAQLGGAPIPNPANYLSINPWLQTIYVRVINTGATDCPSITTFDLIVNPFPVINTTPDDYELCDDDTDGIQIFDLSLRIANVLDGLDPSLHTVSFHQTEAEAILGTPQLPTTYSSSTQTVWVRVVINATGCFDVAPLELIVHPLPIANLPTPLTLCDDNNPGDEEEEFDLTQAIAEIVGTQQGLEVTFHFTLLQAQQGTNALPTLYTNVTNVQTIHVRVFNPVTTCYSTTTLDLRVEPLPILLLPIDPITLCDDNNDGVATFDLGALIPDLLNGASNITVSFHETEQEALDGNNDLPLSYLSILPWQQFIYIRAEHNTTGCVRVMMLELNVNPRPEVPTDLEDLVQCDTDGNQQNGLSIFDLTVQTPIVLAAQSGVASDYQVGYFTSEAAAIDNIGAIVNVTTYPNTSNPQTIWVRVTHLVTGCFHTGSFDLIVNIPLALTVPDPISLCDEALPNDQFTEFDLTIRDNAITNGLGGYSVTYYPSYQNALDDANAIQDPTAYTNAVAAVQTLGVRVTSEAGCSSFTTLTIRVIPRPEPLFDPEPIEVCDNNNPGDGLENFDLTQRELYILNGASLTEFSLTYFESLADAQNETNPIPDPTNYDSTDSDTQIIYVRVTRIPTNPLEPRCYEIVELQLIVNPLPDIVSPVNLYQCVALNQSVLPFTLSQANEDVLGEDQSEADFTVTYYASQVDAEAGSPQLPTIYTSTSVLNAPETIYVRVENNVTGCFIVGTVDLIVEEGTIANAIPVDDPAVTKCDDQDDTNDGRAEFNLDADVTPILVGTNNYPDTVVYYFESLTVAQAAAAENDYSGALSGTNLTAFINTTPMSQEIYAVLVNPNTQSGCPTIVPVTLTVHKLPEPTVQDDFICADPLTGAIIREAILASGLDPATHEFQWSDSNGNILGTGASLTVNTPGAYTLTVINTETEPECSNTVTVNVVQSEQATLSYVQSNYFTDNATITIFAEGITIPDQGNANYVYSLDYGPFQSSNVFTNVSAGSHLVTVQDLNGCQDATIEVYVVNYPLFFTPNGDGYNDTWNIFTLRDTNPNAKIYIFDRYGKFLKQIAPQGQGWDGTFNGENLPSTDYWFTVEYVENGQNKIFKAHFSLKR
ncbi:PKD-like domain-containing protein [Flavobacterium sp.]|uniref:PKD-like domain-containing protein n=1 Tax=Flavobacterium sp. TaxID=239 RepID=UPI003529CFAB